MHGFIVSRYSGLRLVDIANLTKVIPLTIENLENHIRTTSQATATCLRERWIGDCCEIIKNNREDIEARVDAEELVRIHMQLNFNAMKFQQNQSHILP